MYANLYVVLVGGPASGKTQAVRAAERIARRAALRFAPDCLTKAAFVDALGEAFKVYKTNGKAHGASALACFNEEMSNLIPAYDPVFLGVLNHVWDAPDWHDDRTRHGPHVRIELPLVTMLTAITPAQLGEIMPESAWGTGFMTRVIAVSTNAKRNTNDVFAEAPHESEEWGGLGVHLRELTRAWGEMTWEPEARSSLNEWRSQGCPPAPTHPRLMYYNERRWAFAVKTAMVSAMSRYQGDSMCVRVDDFNRARTWLIEAEGESDSMFAEMRSGANDRGVIDTLVASVRAQGKPISEAEMFALLSSHVSVERIPRVLEAAVKMGLLKASGDIWARSYTASQGESLC